MEKERKQNFKKSTSANSRFAKAGGSSLYDSVVLNSSFVHLMKFSAENPRLRKAAKRCAKLYLKKNEKHTKKVLIISELLISL